MDQKQRMSEALAASAAVPDSFVLLLLWAVVALDFRDEVQSVLMVYLIHEKHVASAVFRLSMEFDFLLPSLRRAIQMRDKSSATEAVDKLLSRLSLG